MKGTYMEELFNRYFSGNMSEDEKVDFLSKVMADESLKKEFIQMKNLIALTSFASSLPEDEFRTKVRLDELRKRKMIQYYKRLSLKISRYAAIVVLVVCSTLFVTERYKMFQGDDAFNEIVVPVGQKVYLSLSDGSTVWLNSQTKIRFPKSFDAHERQVFLDGEAYFEVSKDASKPFVVNTGSGRVKVLGTKFNVFNYGSHATFETTLLEGSVLVQSADRKEEVVLKPNEQAVMLHGKLEKVKVDAEKCLSWRDGILDFEEQPLGEILKKLESYYGVTFVVKNPGVLKEIVSGKFRVDDSIVDILDAIQKTERLKYTISMDKKIVYIM